MITENHGKIIPRRTSPERLGTHERALAGYRRYVELVHPLASTLWIGATPGTFPNPFRFDDFLRMMNYKLLEESDVPGN